MQGVYFESDVFVVELSNCDTVLKDKKVVIVNSKLTHNLFAWPLIHYYTGGLWIQSISRLDAIGLPEN
jgi:hypothetical protein